MLQISKKNAYFAQSVEKDWQHQGELLNFDPPVNLQNSSDKGKSLQGCFSCSSIYTAYSFVESAHIYTCRCELIFILIITGIAEPAG